jgi:hypothetical protein
MAFWKENIDKIILLNDKTILQGKGKISNEQMEKKVDALFASFDAKRKIAEAQKADEQDLEELKALENKIKAKKNKQWKNNKAKNRLLGFQSLKMLGSTSD